MARVALAGFRLQLWTMRRDRDCWLSLIMTPFLTTMLMLVVLHADRPDLVGAAVLAPVLMTIWLMSLMVSGEIIDADRWAGTLEATIAAPGPLSSVVFGRVLAVSGLAVLAIPEALLVAWALFGVHIELHHPVLFAGTIAVTVGAASGTALWMAALFTLTRTARTFQNSLSYPIYVLAGVFVPVSFLPAWVRPLSRGIFLSWSADLFRDALRPADVEAVPLRLTMIGFLGAAAYIVGRLLLLHVLRRVRANGSAGWT